MLDIPKKYNYSLWKTQDELNKDLYIFELFDKKTMEIEQRRSAKSPKAMANKIKKLVEKLNI